MGFWAVKEAWAVDLLGLMDGGGVDDTADAASPSVLLIEVVVVGCEAGPLLRVGMLVVVSIAGSLGSCCCC